MCLRVRMCACVPLILYMGLSSSSHLLAFVARASLQRRPASTSHSLHQSGEVTSGARLTNSERCSRLSNCNSSGCGCTSRATAAEQKSALHCISSASSDQHHWRPQYTPLPAHTRALHTYSVLSRSSTDYGGGSASGGKPKFCRPAYLGLGSNRVPFSPNMAVAGCRITIHLKHFVGLYRWATGDAQLHSLTENCRELYDITQRSSKEVYLQKQLKQISL